MTTLSFFVPGEPKTKGSMIPMRAGNHLTVRPDNKRSKNWENVVATYARLKFRGDPAEGAIIMNTKFYLPRPKSHYGSGKNADTIKAGKPELPILHSTGDLDKLERCVWDALTGIIYVDDSQVCGGERNKVYALLGEETGVMITVGFK